ncbi:MAG: fibronectin type III domain-containing protein [Planctomycetes bacterium]|nr:fibronectin type III domain-containing protein [Planctomycetota bacterium]
MFQRNHSAAITIILAAIISATGCGSGMGGDLNSNTGLGKTDNQELIPEAPYGLTVYTSDFSLPYLSWIDNSVNEDGFRIERKAGVGGAYIEISVVPADTVSYNDMEVVSSKIYYYRVKAYNSSGDSAYSNSMQVIAPELKAKAPNPPSSLAATAISDSQIILSWQDNSGIEEGFAIEMGKDESDMKLINIAPSNTVLYNITGLTVSTCCFFKVKAFNFSGDSAYSNIAFAETMQEDNSDELDTNEPDDDNNGQMIGVMIPDAPANLSASAVSEGRIDIIWNDNSTGETGFSIERKSGSGAVFAEAAVMTPNTESYSDTGLEEAAYYYRLRAFNPAGWSAYSNIVVATTIPKSPSALTVVNVTDTQVTLSWQDKSKVETNFIIERKTGTKGVFEEIGSVYASISTFTDTGLAGLTGYSYRVKAHNNSGYSGYSNITEAVTEESLDAVMSEGPVAGGDEEEPASGQAYIAAPEGQTNLSAVAVSETGINLMWQDNFSNEEGYRIEMSNNGIVFFQIYSSDPNVSVYACVQLEPSTGYYFRVKAYNSAGESGYSNIAHTVTLSLPDEALDVPDAPDVSEDISDEESDSSEPENVPAPEYMIGVCDYSQVKAANGLYVSGHYAYVTDYNTGLKIINISDPAEPVLVGSLDTAGTAYDVFVEGNYAYIADGDAGLQIFDISNPAMPVWTGSLSTQWGARSVFVSNGYAFIASGDGGLCMADVMNISNPVFAGFCDTPGAAEDVYVFENYAYIADGSDGLQIIDVSNPPTLSVVGSYDTEGWAYGVVVSGGYVYVADGANGLQVLNTEDPANIVLAGSYGINGVAHGIYAFGSYIYVAGEDGGLHKINVSNPAVPVLAGAYDTAGKSLAVFVSGDYTYMADWNMGLVVLDTTDPVGPAIVGSHDTFGWAYDVFVSEYYAYVADGDFGLQIFDVSDYSLPVLKGSYSAPGWVLGVYVSGQYAYLSVQEFGLYIVDVSDKSNPVLMGSCDTTGWAYNTYVSGNYAYVADWDAGLVVIDITNPAGPFIAGCYDTPGNAYSVAVLGNYAYVADKDYGMLAIDITNPALPVFAGEYIKAGAINEICANNQYAYVACGVEGLLVLDISDPANPVMAGSFDTAGEAIGICLSAGNIYIADSEAGLLIINIADTANLAITGVLDTAGSARGVFVAGDYAFMADYNAGLKIIE